MVFFSGIQQKLFSFSRRSCIAVPAAGHAGGGAPVQDGSSVDPGQARWRVLWELKSNHGVALRGARAEQGNVKPAYYQRLCSQAGEAKGEAGETEDQLEGYNDAVVVPEGKCLPWSSRPT